MGAFFTLTGEVLRYRTALTDDCAHPKETQNRTKNQCTMSRDYRIYGKSSNNQIYIENTFDDVAHTVLIVINNAKKHSLL